MLRLLLPILLTALSPADDGWQPTDAELERAHQMLAGSWQFLSINDKGENLGPRLVEARFARDGLLTIADRRMTIVNPVTGEQRTSSFRIDPSKNPRRIDLITRDDRMLRGIYRFEDDTLVFYLQPDESKDRPAAFASPDPSDLIVVRLKPLSHGTPTAAKTAPRRDDRPSIDGSNGASLSTFSVQRPSEGELRRAHELLSGDWDILSMKDDGEVLAPDLIRAKFAEDGRVRIGTRSVAIVSPKAGERRLSAIRIDPSKTPSEVDLTTQFDEVLRGIYQFSGDELLVCLAKRDDDARPTVFDAPAGSSDLLFRLKMANSDRSSEAAAAQPAPKRSDSTQDKDEQVRKRIVGAWSLNDSQGNLTLVFRTDGTFVVTRTWRGGLKKLFEGNTTTSDGRWSYKRGLLDAFVTSSMDPKLVARNYNYWVQSIGDDTLVVKTLFGQLMTARRLR